MDAPVTRDWENLALLARYDAKELAKLCHMSVRQLQRDFRHRLKRTPQDWLNEQRIRAARPLLQLGQPVKVVAIELGFKQTSHFCRQFKNYFQTTPSQCTGLLEPSHSMSLTDNKCR